MEVRERGDAERLSLRGDVRTAANCVLAQLERETTNSNTLLWRDNGRVAEIISKRGGETVFVTDVLEVGGRTEAALYISDIYALFGIDRERRRKALSPC